MPEQRRMFSAPADEGAARFVTGAKNVQSERSRTSDSVWGYDSVRVGARICECQRLRACATDLLANQGRKFGSEDVRIR